MKLPAPTDNPHRAFCTKGCYGSFYLSRCSVCENAKPQGSRKFCRRPKCRTEYRKNEQFFAFSGVGSPTNTLGVRKPRKSGTKTAHICRLPLNVLGGYRWPNTA